MAKKQSTRRYRRMRDELRESGDKGFCAVIAIAAVTGESVKTVQATLSDVGRKIGEGTTRAEIQSALRHLGYVSRAANRTEVGHNLATKATTNQLDNQARKGLEGRKYLAITRGHCLAVVDDRVQCHTANTRHRLLDIYEILPADELEQRWDDYLPGA